MTTIALPIPDSIIELHHHNLDAVRHEAHQGFIVWEYLNGHLSLDECGTLLEIGYRGFLELLWEKGIALDGSHEDELQQQMTAIEQVLERV